MTKNNIIAIIIGLALIGGALWFIESGPQDTTGVADKGSTETANNVSVVDGIQIIEISARGGYQPRKSTAKAGLPTKIRFNTSSTFDCSSSVRIPSLGISKILPQTGETVIDLGVQAAGKLQGMCGMGMYPFEIEFQ